MKRVLKWVVGVLALVFVAIQLVPVSRENPAGGEPLAAPAEVVAILKRACFDCHSNETVWPWYSYVAPVSWLVAHDVEEGREHLNFSEFSRYSDKKRSSKASDVVEEIEHGQMPPSQYLLMHADAKVSPAEVKVLEAWNEGL